jgi:hypothetical protein
MGLERLLNSCLLGSVPALASTVATRFSIGLASAAAGTVLVVVGLGLWRQRHHDDRSLSVAGCRSDGTSGFSTGC